MTRCQRGFSLIEILIALGILASAIATIMGGVGTAMSMQSRDEKMLQAVWLANNRMTELQAEIQADIEKKKFPDEKEESGQFDAPMDLFSWKYAIVKVEIPLAGSLGDAAAGGDGEGSAEAGGAVRAILQKILKDISKAVRELKLSVTWIDDEDGKEKSIDITTHIVNLNEDSK